MKHAHNAIVLATSTKSDLVNDRGFPDWGFPKQKFSDLYKDVNGA
jgi:hypothetical protein